MRLHISRLIATLYMTLQVLTAPVESFGIDTHPPIPVGEDQAFIRANSALPSDSLVRLAWESIRQERYDSAATYYMVVASRYSPDAPRDEIIRAATASVNIADIWICFRMNGEQAYPWLIRAREMASMHRLPDVEIGVNSNLGQLYHDYGNYARSLDYLEKAMQGVVTNHSDLYYTMCLMELATVAVLNNQYSRLRDSIGMLRLYQPADSIPQADYASALLESLTLATESNYRQGASHLENALHALSMDTDKLRYLVMHHFMTGKMYLDSGNLPDAIRNFRRGVEIASSGGCFNLMEKGCIQLEKCYNRLQKVDSAYYFQNRAIAIRDSLFSASAFEAVKESEIANHISRLNTDIETAELSSRYHKRISIVLLICGALLTGIVVWLAISRRRLNSAYRDLYRKNMDLIMSADSHTSAATIPSIPSSAKEAEGDAPVPKETSVPNEADMVIMRQVEKVMKESDRIYDPGFSIESLAAMIGVHPRSVSKAINSIAGRNFSALVCEYRIRKACLLLSDTDRLRSVKIESVAESVGYRSRTHFSKIFKDVTGLTPSQFISQVIQSGKRNPE